MATKIRLRLIGKKKRPFFRIVVADESTKRSGKVLESIGYFDPTTKPSTVKIDEKKFKKWLSLGAQPTEAVRKLIKP